MANTRKLTASQWISENPTLRVGELGVERDTKKEKLGDGVTPWVNLPYRFNKAIADTVYVKKPEGITDGQVPVWDADTATFIPGNGGGDGAVSSVVGQIGVVTGSQILADTSVAAALAAKLDAAQKGVASGVATLDSGSKIPTSQIPDLSASYATPGSVTSAVTPKLDAATAASTYAPKTTVIPKWAASTAYTAGDKVVSPSGDIVSAISTFTSGVSYNAANWAMSPNLVIKPSGILDGQVPVWNSSTSTWVSGVATKFIATSADTTGVTDKAAIQAAIDSAAAAGGGTVLIDGKYYVNGPLVLKVGVTLAGTGWKRTEIHLAAASNGSVITCATDAYGMGLRDLYIDGHSELQTAGGNGGVYLYTIGGPADAADFRGGNLTLVTNVRVQYTYGNGIVIKGAMNESRISNCIVIRAKGYGFFIDSMADTWIFDCTSGESGNHGFNVTGALGVRMHGCKSWFSGICPARGAAVSLTSPTNTSAAGYYFSGQNLQVVNCEAQDNASEGFIITGTNGQYTIHGDANKQAHVRLMGATMNDVRLLVGTGTSHSIRTAAVLHLWGTSNLNNTFRSNFDDNSPSGVAAALIGGLTDAAYFNDIVIGTPEAVNPKTYAATLTPDPVRGGFSTTLTGNVTIANPAVDRRIHGQEFEIWLTQDATGGRTVAFGTDFIGVSTADTTANKVNRWRFRCHAGTKWYQVAYQAY